MPNKNGFKLNQKQIKMWIDFNQNRLISVTIYLLKIIGYTFVYNYLVMLLMLLTFQLKESRCLAY